MASLILALLSGLIAILLTAATCGLLAVGGISAGWVAWVIFGAWLTLTLHVIRAQARRARA